MPLSLVKQQLRRVLVVELSRETLAIAKARAERSAVDADLKLGDAQHLDLPDQSFDTAVCTLALCSIPDDARAVQYASRILRPGGRMVLMEQSGARCCQSAWCRPTTSYAGIE
jgi:ubiquinone/menaquinone biosynthesis C-methylase UbiE